MGTDIYEELRRAIVEYDNQSAQDTAQKIVDLKLDLMKAVDVMTQAIKKVGDG